MTRIAFWARTSKLAAQIDKKLEPEPPYQHRATRLINWLMAIDSRVRLAAHVAWLALSGDQVFFHRWEARHVQGIERYRSDEKREKQRLNLVAAAEVAGDLKLREELGAVIRKNQAQAKEIRQMQESAERRNRDLAALHIVWCDGGCPGGVGAPETLDRPTVLAAVQAVERLVSWWNNNQYRKTGTRELVEFEPPVVKE